MKPFNTKQTHCVVVLQNLDAPSLQNVSLTLASNQLVAVIGPVGAGKVSHQRAATTLICSQPV